MSQSRVTAFMQHVLLYLHISTRSSSSPRTSRVTRCFTGHPLNTASRRGSGASWRYAPRGKTGWWSVSWREDPSTSSKCVPSLMSSRGLTVRWRWSGHWKKVNKNFCSTVWNVNWITLLQLFHFLFNCCIFGWRYKSQVSLLIVGKAVADADHT